jgi:hypothetical protein
MALHKKFLEAAYRHVFSRTVTKRDDRADHLTNPITSVKFALLPTGNL